MGIENPNTIDMVVKGESGPVLVITDAGLAEGQERFSMLIEKLRSYVSFILSGQFNQKYPNTTPNDVKIRVMCRVPPTGQMEKVTDVQVPGREGLRIPVEFEVFAGAG